MTRFHALAAIIVVFLLIFGIISGVFADGGRESCERIHTPTNCIDILRG